jgi:hypothetical protein
MPLTQVSAALLSSEANAQGFRNRIINGDMRIDQRNSGASVTGNFVYTVDRWAQAMSGGGVLTAQRSTTAPANFTNSLSMTVTTADSSIAAGDYYWLYQVIEGLNCADLGWGTANAQSVTLSFQVRSSVTGTFSGGVENAAGNRGYVFTYTINAANTWETKTVTIPGDTTGTWATDNTAGIQLNFDMGTGSTRTVSTANVWGAQRGIGLTSATKLISTGSATWFVTGVQLEAGTVAEPFERIDYGRQLIQCQRYYYFLTSFSETNFGNIGLAYNYTSTQMFCLVPFPVTMRIAPALVATSGTNFYLFERNGGDDFLNSLSLSGTTTPKVGAVSNSSEISGTAGQAGRLITYTAGASVAFNAEL